MKKINFVGLVSKERGGSEKLQTREGEKKAMDGGRKKERENRIEI